MSYCLTDKKSCKKQKTNILKKKRPSIILKITVKVVKEKEKRKVKEK